MADSGPETPRGPPMEVAENGLYVMRTQADVLRVARTLLETGAVPSSFRSPQQVAVAIQGLRSLGLNPYASIRQTGFINGAMTIYGDLPIAIARSTGQVESFEEFGFCLAGDGTYQRQCFEASNCHKETFGFVCRVQRQGQSVHEVVFTQAHAKAAGLWGRTPTWRSYPTRMMQMRARSQALKDVFSDALAGIAIREFDIEGVVEEVISAPQNDTVIVDDNASYGAYGLDTGPIAANRADSVKNKIKRARNRP